MNEPWSPARATRHAVYAAADRMRPNGHPELADLILTNERTRTANAVQQIAARPWMDVFGLIHCPTCAGVTNPPKGVINVGTCRCPTTRGPRRAHGIAA